MSYAWASSSTGCITFTSSPALAIPVVSCIRQAGQPLATISAPVSARLAIFRSSDQGASFEKVVSWSKADLNVGEQTVLVANIVRDLEAKDDE